MFHTTQWPQRPTTDNKILLAWDLQATINSKMGNTLSSKEEMVSSQGLTMAKCWENNFPRITVFSFTQKQDLWGKKLKELGLFCLEKRRLKEPMITVFQYEKACWRQVWWTVLCGCGKKDEKLICSQEDFRAIQERRERLFSLGRQSEQVDQSSSLLEKTVQIAQNKPDMSWNLAVIQVVGHFVTPSSPTTLWLSLDTDQPHVEPNGFLCQITSSKSK